MFSVGAVNKVMSIQNQYLVRTYGLEDLSGDALERSINREDGTVNGATQADGRTPYGAPCYGFDGSNDWIECDTGASDLDDWNEGTVIVLFNPDSVSGMQTFFHARAGSDNIVQIRCTDDALQFFLEVNGVEESSYNGSELAVDTWYTAAMSWEDNSGDGDVFYYKNGSQLDTDSTSQTMSSETFTDLAIGAYYWGGAENYSGLIGPVFCWKGVRLTADEIALADRILRGL